MIKKVLFLIIIFTTASTTDFKAALNPFSQFLAQQRARTATPTSEPTPAPIIQEEPEEVPQPEEPAPQEGPKLVQFNQRAESKYIEPKQVEGANNGGSATTPDKDLAAWFSEPLFDRPTEASWLSDENYQPDDPSQNNSNKTGPQVVKKAKVATGKVLNAVGSGGGAMGSFGTPGAAPQNNNAAQAADALRLSVMQAGIVTRDEADSSKNKTSPLGLSRTQQAWQKARGYKPAMRNKSTQTQQREIINIFKDARQRRMYSQS